MSFSKVAQNDARSLKKIGCKLSHKVGGGDQNQKGDKCHTFLLFSTLTGSLSLRKIKAWNWWFYNDFLQ